MLSLLYLGFGMLVTVIALDALRDRARDPQGWRLAAALGIGMLVWPLALLTLWYERARVAWQDAQPNPAAWPQPQAATRYRPHPRVTVTVRYPPRTVRHLGRWTVLHDPAISFDAPLLPHPWGLTLATPAGRFHLLRPAQSEQPHPAPPHHTQSGFTLVEILVVIAVIGILAAALVTGFGRARASAEDKAGRLHLQTCVASAEQRRSLITNTVTLPATCEALGVARPANIQSTAITLSGGTYTVTVQARAGGTTLTLQDTLPRTITP